MSLPAQRAVACAASLLRMVIVCAMTALSWPAAAQQPAEPDAARLAAARLLAEQLHPRADTPKFIQMFIETQMRVPPSRMDNRIDVAELKARLSEQLHTEIVDVMSAAYARAYSLDEIEALVTFHARPAGRHFHVGTPRVRQPEPPEPVRSKVALALAEEIYDFNAKAIEHLSLGSQSAKDPQLKQRFIDDATERFAQMFSLDELKELLAFHTSPLGRKFLATNVSASLLQPMQRAAQSVKREMAKLQQSPSMPR